MRQESIVIDSILVGIGIILILITLTIHQHTGKPDGLPEITKIKIKLHDNIVRCNRLESEMLVHRKALLKIYNKVYETLREDEVIREK